MTKNKSLDELFKQYELDKEDVESFKKFITWIDMESKGDSIDSKKLIKNLIEDKFNNDNQ